MSSKDPQNTNVKNKKNIQNEEIRRYTGGENVNTFRACFHTDRTHHVLLTERQ